MREVQKLAAYGWDSLATKFNRSISRMRERELMIDPWSLAEIPKWSSLPAVSHLGGLRKNSYQMAAAAQQQINKVFVRIKLG
jgi:hypothetical protein